MTNKVKVDVALEDQFLKAQNLISESRTNGRSDAFGAIRTNGAARFSETGFPAPRNEAWKYTPVRRWLNDPFDFSAGAPISEIPHSEFLSSDNRFKAVCIDGVFSPELSAVPSNDVFSGYIGSIADAPLPENRVLDLLQKINPGTESVFDSLNQSFFEDGLLIYFPRETRLEEPLFVINLITQGANVFRQARTLIIADPLAEGTVVELRDQESEDGTFENTLVQVEIGAGAHIDCYHVFDRGSSARLVRKLNVYQEADSTFSTNEFTLSGALVRSDLNFLPDGEGCDTHLNGFYLAKDNMHVDVHTMVDHSMPRCVSNELFKGIIGDTATAVFNGRVLVRQDAQQINAYQSNRNIVLSETAQMFSKPELEIYADDVKCSHGATTGQIEPEALFYLRSRGIPEAEARVLLMQAFAADVLDLVKVESLRENLQNGIVSRLANSVRY